MGKWTWKNDNNKHKHHKTCNSNLVNFSMMIKLKELMEFAITSHVSYIQLKQNKSIWNFSFMISQTGLMHWYGGFHPYIADVP